MQLLLINEVAKIARVSPASVRWWIQSGRLKSVKPGRHRLIRRQDLADFLHVPVEDVAV